MNTREFESRVKTTIKKYNLISRKDKIIVACSGGKDSTSVLYLLNKFGYNAEALMINLHMGKWSERNLENVRRFCKENKIKLHVVDMRRELGSGICYIRGSIQSKTNLRNCTICGVIKRWLLNKKARELKADKIATGHNLDDEAETVLMNLFKGNPELCLGLGPKTGIIKDKRFVQRIKPLYFCTNREVMEYSKKMMFPVLYEPCPCSLESGFRRRIRSELSKLDERVKFNIVDNFLKILPKLREKYKTDKKLRYCNICGEPSRKDICMRCGLLKILKS